MLHALKHRFLAPVVVLAGVTALDAVARAEDISSLPFSITQPGTYTLTADLHMIGSTAISIAASDVILDLGGYTLSGTGGYEGGYGDGVAVSPGFSNVTIRNGTILQFEIATGIMLNGVTGCTVSNVTVRECSGGIGMLDGGGHTIENNTLDNNIHANISTNTSGNIIQGNTCTGAGWSIRLGGAASANMIVGNTCDGSSAGSIDLTDTDGNSVIGNTVSNAWIGIYGEASDSNLVQGNLVHDSLQGITLHGVDNTILLNTADNNPETGIFVSGSDITLRWNTATGNGTGIYLPSSNDCTLEQNIASDNANDGIIAWTSAAACGGHTLRGNVANGNGASGIRVSFCGNNTLRDNKATGNGTYGIAITDSGGNRLHKNASLNNTLLDLVDSTCFHNQWKRNTFGTREGTCIE